MNAPRTRPRFTDLPASQRQAAAAATRLQIISLVYLTTAVTVVFLVMGSSQAMKVAWVEDCLSFLPPLAFLVAMRQTRRAPDEEHPYGYHRAIGAGHLAASVALLALGVLMVADSGSTLIMREHPTIGTMVLFGQPVWQGWVMIAALVYTGLPDVLLGRAKMRLAESLHDKVLYADADMNKADWMTAGGAILGVLGIGAGLWWADSVVANLIAASIVKDGVTNVRAAVGGLLDRQARTYDDASRHPVFEEVRSFFGSQSWVRHVQVRMRDEGHVFHTEVFLVPVDDELPLARLESARRYASALDWKLRDLAVIPVAKLPQAGAE